MIRASPPVINLYVPMYVGAEFVGGILGTVGIWIAYGSLAREVALLAATFPRRCRGPQGAFGGDPDRLYPGLRSDLGGHRREGPSGCGPLAVGFALACGVLSAGPVTGGSANPCELWDRRSWPDISTPSGSA